MSNALITRLRKQREGKVTIGKFVFVVRRPTDVEMLQLRGSKKTWAEASGDYVVDWANVTENDIVGGGGSDVVAFDRALWLEWYSDRTDFWEPIGQFLIDAYEQHKKDIEVAEKK